MSTKYKVKDNAKLIFIARTIVGLQVRRKNKHGLQVRANGGINEGKAVISGNKNGLKINDNAGESENNPTAIFD